MQWSRGYHTLIMCLPCTDHVINHELITWVSCTDHVDIKHCSRGWTGNDDVATMYWSRDWSCTDYIIDHALTTWLIMHWWRGYHALLTRLIMQWSPSSHVLVTWLIMHWSRNWSCTENLFTKNKRQTGFGPWAVLCQSPFLRFIIGTDYFYYILTRLINVQARVKTWILQKNENIRTKGK